MESVIGAAPGDDGPEDFDRFDAGAFADASPVTAVATLQIVCVFKLITMVSGSNVRVFQLITMLLRGLITNMLIVFTLTECFQTPVCFGLGRVLRL